MNIKEFKEKYGILTLGLMFDRYAEMESGPRRNEIENQIRTILHNLESALTVQPDPVP